MTSSRRILLVRPRKGESDGERPVARAVRGFHGRIYEENSPGHSSSACHSINAYSNAAVASTASRD